MKKQKLEIEVWKPVNNAKLEEIHHYFNNQYVFGLNPCLISKAAYKKIFAIFEEELIGKKK